MPSATRILSSDINGQRVSYPFRHQIGVGVVLLDGIRGRNVLVGKRKNCAGSGTLSLPGGHLEPDESILECAKRELHEECGIDPRSVIEARGPGMMCFEDVVDGEVFLTVYVVLCPSKTLEEIVVSNAEPDKCEGWEWMPVSRLFKKKMFCDSQKVLETLREQDII